MAHGDDALTRGGLSDIRRSEGIELEGRKLSENGYEHRGGLASCGYIQYVSAGTLGIPLGMAAKVLSVWLGRIN